MMGMNILFENWKVIFTSVTMLALLIPAYPQDDEVLRLSLQEAQKHAIEYNWQVENARLDMAGAEKRIWESVATGLPQIDAMMDYTNFMGADIIFRFDESLPPQTIPFKPTSNLVFTVNQLIFSGNYIVGLQAAKVYKLLTERNYEKSEIDIKQQVANSYYLVLISERTLEIIEQNLANMRKTYENTKAMARVGIAENTDADQLEVSVTMLENSVRSTERQIELYYNMLRFQLGLDINAEIMLTERLDEILDRVNFRAVLNQSFYLENHIDYRIISTQEDLNSKQLGLEVMNYLPSINGFYSHQEKILKPNFDMQPKNMIGLTMNVPIFSSGMRQARVAQARINLEKTQNTKSLVEEQLLLQEKQFRFNLRNALERYESQKQNVEVARRVLNSFNLKFQQGILTSLDLTVANDNYLQAENNLITSIMELLNADLELEILLNNL
jgi:outer membrane protein TolC